jgi:hypothetical protein
LPQLRFYPNGLKGAKKQSGSFEILVNPETTTVKDVLDELDSAVVHEVKEVTEQIMQTIAQQVSIEDKKFAIFYMYKKGDVSIHYKALTTLEIFKDSVAFHSIFQPSSTITEALQLKKLPAIMGVMPAKDENSDQM